MFRRSFFILLLPTLMLIGGAVAFYTYFPQKPYIFSPPTPPESSTYHRTGVVKEIYPKTGGRWKIGCHEALLVAPRKGFGEWTEKWDRVDGQWETHHFTARTATFFFHDKRLEAQDLFVQDGDQLTVEAKRGEFFLQSSPPICFLEGGVKGNGKRGDKPFHFETAAIFYSGNKVLTSNGGRLTLDGGWSFPFEGELCLEGDHLELKEGKVIGESEQFVVEGHSLHADLKNGDFSDLHLGDGVTLTHRLTKGGEPIQTGVAEYLDIDLNNREGLLSGIGDERAHFVDKTHGVVMDVDALFFRFDEEGGIEGIEGRGEMSISTMKGEKK